MKKLLLSLALVATMASADELPTTNKEILEHCNIMANIAVYSAVKRKTGATQEEFMGELKKAGEDKDFPPEIREEIQTALAYGWLAMGIVDDPRQVGPNAMRACVDSHRNRLKLPPLGKTT